MCWRNALLVALALGTGCGDSTGDPQPIPIPGPRRDLLRNTGGRENLDQPVRVIGLPRSVKESVQVSVENLRLQSEVTVIAADTGSFWVEITARLGDLLRVGVENGTETVELAVPKDPSISSIILPPRPIAGVPPITENGDGTVTVQGLVSPAETVIVTNASSGAVKSAVAAGDGRFSVKLPARSKDTIVAYRDAKTLAAPWELSVP
jgi:hypothetical protein